MIHNGLELYSYFGYNKNEIFTLIRAPLELLRSYADISNYEMTLDHKVLASVASQGFPDLGIAPLKIADYPSEDAYSPYQHIKAKYETSIPEEYYYRPAGSPHPFRSLIRLKLTKMIIEERSRDGGSPIKISRYISDKRLLACFPIHDQIARENLIIQWSNFTRLPWRQPITPFKVIYLHKHLLYNNIII